MSSQRPPPSRTEVVAKGALRVAGAVMKGAYQETMRAHADYKQNQQQREQYQQQQQQPVVVQGRPAHQPVAKARPLETPQASIPQPSAPMMGDVEQPQPPPRQHQQQQQQYQQHDKHQQYQQHQQQVQTVYVIPQVYAEVQQPPRAIVVAQRKHRQQFADHPTLIGTTLGWNWGVAASMQESIAIQFAQMDHAQRGAYQTQFEQALATNVCCCCMALSVMAQMVVMSLVNAVVLAFGNAGVALWCIPVSIGQFSSSACASPRMSAGCKFFAVLLFPLLAVSSVFSVMVISLGHGFFAGCQGSPDPWCPAGHAVAVYWSQGMEWRRMAYKQFESHEGPYYDLSWLLLLVTIPLYIPLGGLIGFVAFTVVAFGEAPRLWYLITFRSVRETHPCYPCAVMCGCMWASVYVVFVIFCAPVAGLVAGVSTGYASAVHRPSYFFEDQYNTITRYMSGLDIRNQGHQ